MAAQIYAGMASNPVPNIAEKDPIKIRAETAEKAAKAIAEEVEEWPE